MDFFHALYPGTPGKQALEGPLGLKPGKSMHEAAAEKPRKMLEFPGIDHRSDPEFFEDCRGLEGSAP